MNRLFCGHFCHGTVHQGNIGDSDNAVFDASFYQEHYLLYVKIMNAYLLHCTHPLLSKLLPLSIYDDSYMFPFHCNLQMLCFIIPHSLYIYFLYTDKTCYHIELQFLSLLVTLLVKHHVAHTQSCSHVLYIVSLYHISYQSQVAHLCPIFEVTLQSVSLCVFVMQRELFLFLLHVCIHNLNSRYLTACIFQLE